MKERPILFSAPMVRALLAGTKTQTRRIAGDVRHPDLGNVYSPGALVLEREPQHVIDRCCPKGAPGDRLWVRESWAYNPDFPGLAAHACFMADPAHRYDGLKWKPSIHMPRAVCRILLEITEVRLQRLQDISEADAVAEGIVRQRDGGYGLPDGEHYHCHSARMAFWSLWETLHGDSSVEANPWLWAVTFKRVTP